MQKALLSLLFCAIFSVWSTAQISISVSPGTVSGSGLPNALDIPAYCHITNNSAFTVNVMWIRDVVNAPQAWWSWVCDMEQCYLPSVDANPDNRPNELGPGQSFELSYHIRAFDIEGQGEYKLYLYELSEPQTILDSVQFLFETSTTSVADQTAETLRIYPNPTTSYFQIQNAAAVTQVVIYNIVGNKMREFDARNTSRFDVADLTEGIYLVRLLDANHTVLKTVRLSKR